MEMDLCSRRATPSPAGTALPSARSTVASAKGSGVGADTAATTAATADPAPVVPTPTAEMQP